MLMETIISIVGFVGYVFFAAFCNNISEREGFVGIEQLIEELGPTRTPENIRLAGIITSYTKYSLARHFFILVFIVGIIMILSPGF